MPEVPAATAGAADGAVAHLGEKRLSTVHAIGQSLAVGPIFSVGAISGLIAGRAGFNTPLSVLLGAIGALCLGYVISVYARRYAGAGAMYEYVVRGGHPDVGVFSAGLYAIGLLFLGGGGVFIAIGFLAQGFFAAHWTALDGIDWWIWGAIGLAIATGLNHFGVRLAVRGVLVLAALSAIPLILTALLVIAKGGADVNTLKVLDPGQTSWNSVFNGILFAVTLFIGFEIAASIGEEAHNPQRAIPRAVIGTILLSSAFYLLVTYAATIGFGAANIDAYAGSQSPIGDIAAQYVGKGMSAIVDLVIVFDAISVAIAFTVGASRVLFALGRDRLLPRAMASTTRHDTPLGGNLVIVAAGLACLIYGAAASYGLGDQAPPDEVIAFGITSAAGSYLIEAIYVILALFAIRLVWRAGREGLWWKIPVILVGLVTPLLAYKGSLDPWPTYPTNRGVYLAIAAIMLCALWYAYLKLRHPERIRSAASHAIEHHGVPPLDETLDFEPVPSDSLLRPKEV